MADSKDYPVLKDELTEDAAVDIDATASTTDNDLFTGNSTQAQTQRQQVENSEAGGSFSSVSGVGDNRNTEGKEQSKDKKEQLAMLLLSQLNDINIQIENYETFLTLGVEINLLKEVIENLKTTETELETTVKSTEAALNQAKANTEEAQSKLESATKAIEDANILEIECEVDGEINKHSIMGNENGGYHVMIAGQERVEITDGAQIAAIKQLLDDGKHLGNENSECQKICDDRDERRAECKEAKNIEKIAKRNLTEAQTALKDVKSKITDKTQKLDDAKNEFSIKKEELGYSDLSDQEAINMAKGELGNLYEKKANLEGQLGKLNDSSATLTDYSSKLGAALSDHNHEHTEENTNDSAAFMASLEALNKQGDEVFTTVKENYKEIQLLEEKITELEEAQATIKEAQGVIEDFQGETRMEFLSEKLDLFSLGKGSLLQAFIKPLQDEDGNFVYSDENNKLYHMEENPETGNLERSYYDMEADPVAYANLMKEAWAGDTPKMFANESFLQNKDPTNPITMKSAHDYLQAINEVGDHYSDALDETQTRKDVAAGRLSELTGKSKEEILSDPAPAPDQDQMAIDKNKDAIANQIASAGGSISQEELKEIAAEYGIPESRLNDLVKALQDMNEKFQIQQETPTLHADHVPISGTDQYFGNDSAPSQDYTARFTAAAQPSPTTAPAPKIEPDAPEPAEPSVGINPAA